MVLSEIDQMYRDSLLRLSQQYATDMLQLKSQVQFLQQKLQQLEIILVKQNELSLQLLQKTRD